MKKQRGLEIIEVMIIIAIGAILAALVIPAFKDHREKQDVESGLIAPTESDDGFGITPMGASVPSYQRLVQPILVVDHKQYQIYQYSTETQVCSYIYDTTAADPVSISCTSAKEKE